MNLDDFVKKMIEEHGVNNKEELNNLFDDLQGKFYQALLDGEMNGHLGYEKGSHGVKSAENRRNGSSSKNKRIRTDKGEFTVNMPRDREGTFEPIIIPKRKSIVEDFAEVAISFYAKGLSLSDISEMIKKIYKVPLSTEYISNLTKSVSEEVEAWQTRKLQKCYPFVYVDCLYCYVKGEIKSEKKAVYVMLGIDVTGHKEVLGIWISDNEGAHFWAGILEEIKSRGVEEILFISMDGLSGLEEAIELVYSKTITQRCIVHLVRNIYKIVNKKEVKEVISDYKKIYTASNKENAEAEYKLFLEKYKNNKSLIKKVEDNIEHVMQLFDYPVEIRKIIYTTNPIESLNSALRKVTKGKGSFINEEALKKVLYLRIRDLEKKWSKGTSGWTNVLNQLVIIFKKRITKYLEL